MLLLIPCLLINYWSFLMYRFFAATLFLLLHVKFSVVGLMKDDLILLCVYERGARDVTESELL